MHLTILGSGSNGNCTYVETPGARLLVDAGFSLRQIRARLAGIGRTPENLTAILVTHEHSDHVQGLGALCKKLNIPVFCNRLTGEAIEYSMQEKLPRRTFETGAEFEVGDVVVEAFSIPHDAQDPVGFLLRTPDANLGFLTDLGHVTQLVLQRVKAANVLVLETNHDVKLLQDCPRRPWSLKQRILGRHGHLSNTAAAEALTQIMSAELRHLFLGHLSRECNRPELAQRVIHEQLTALGAHHVRLEVAQQQIPCPTLTCSLNGPPATI